MSALSKNAQRWKAWAERHAADRWRTTLAIVRSVGANVDRECEAVGVTRTAYVGAALLAMESLTSGERRAFLRRYADLHGESTKRNQWSSRS